MSLKSVHLLPLKEARFEARRYLADAAKGSDPSEKRREQRLALTVKALADHFLTVIAPAEKLSASYVRACRGFLENVLLPRFGHMKAKTVTRDDIRRMMIDLSRSTPVRANRCLALMSRLMNIAIEQGARTDNPCTHVDKNREEKRTNFFRLTELDSLWKTLDQQRDQHQANAIRLLVLTGARISELRTAEWAHFDLEAAMWSKPAGHTKQRRVHNVPLSDKAMAILKAMHARRDVASPYLFPSTKVKGQPMESFRKFWERVRMEAGLGEVRLYDARHTYASHLLINGVSLGVIGQLLGHSRPQTTMKYAHLSNEAGRAAAGKMGDVVSGIERQAKEPTR